MLELKPISGDYLLIITLWQVLFGWRSEESWSLDRRTGNKVLRLTLDLRNMKYFQMIYF